MEDFPSTDPTHIFAQIRPPMSDYPVYSPPPPSYSPSSPSPSPPSPTSTNISQDIVNIELYTEVETKKKKYSELESREFVRRRNVANPYEDVSSDLFINRAALKLANIDAVFHLIEDIGGMLEPQINNQYMRYACIAEGPGSFVQYIQYRNPQAFGHGITLDTGDSLAWDIKSINMSKFDINYVGKVKGDVINEWKQFSKYVLQTSGPIYLVTADGGVEASHLWDKSGKQQDTQETLNLELIRAEALTALTICERTVDLGPNSGGLKIGGHFVLKIFDSITRGTIQIIYILTKCFQKVSIFKPVSSRPANSERYVVCMGMRMSDVVDPWIPIMESKQDISMEKEFIEWIKKNNDDSMRLQLWSANMILEDKAADDVDLTMCNTLWNIPQKREISSLPPVVCKIPQQTNVSVNKPLQKLVPGKKPLPKTSYSRNAQSSRGRR